MLRVQAAAICLLATACNSGAAQVNTDCQFAQVQQALTLKCLPHSLNPVTDPASPEFGRVPCWMLELGQGDTDFCKCDEPGHRPPTQAQVETALATLTKTGQCRNACCEELCFCEVMQLSGDALAACQGGDNTRVGVDTPGFCYVEPDVGVGDPSTVSGCQPNERQLLLFTPVGATRTALFACEGTIG